ncbi:MAG: TraR/DksA family transcriptional regulator [Planctomycetes bacterium]|nr:TraR/DksA family transcriptional regulator [Planctomycetota bacterium]
MNKTDLETIRAKLLARRDAILEERGRSFRRMQESTCDVAADPVDRAAGNCDFDVAVGQASIEGEELVAVAEALARIEDGAFGLCEECEQPIGDKRLLALPSARYCIGCQTALEKAGLDPLGA